ncbi:MAG: Dam family site-specific DNA-(adenine-N6)-methyltransferase [Ardenticatenia bacterium]|nr:MAG: Dam family site-specific DNA-(adenine-N6)-methyltransferase [Ardenticatenia bacterium]
MDNKSVPRPFLKWAGGKRQLLPVLLQSIPEQFEAYHEPFLGGGALFFALMRKNKIKKAFLSDINCELIETYQAIRDIPNEVLALLRNYPYSKEFFYALRSRDRNSLSLAERAARMIYLNKTCYNGLYRVNKKGQFNVPFGRYKNPKYYDPENILAVSQSLQGVWLECASFEIVLQNASPGDFVYFDPPYIPKSPTSSFTSYTSTQFSLREHEQLRDVCLELNQRNVKVLLSNSYTEYIFDLFENTDFEIYVTYSNRFINSKPTKRGKIPEVLIANYSFTRQMRLLEQANTYTTYS